MEKKLGPDLRKLARLCGVQVAYLDVHRRRRQIFGQALICILQALGVPIHKEADAGEALQEKLHDLWNGRVEPVAVAWNGSAALLGLRLPAAQARGSCSYQFDSEKGASAYGEFRLEDLPVRSSLLIKGEPFVSKELRFQGRFPSGYHQLRIEFHGKSQEALVISAPSGLFAPGKETQTTDWGVFIPPYALHSRRSWGAGDLTDLETLTAWVAKLGGRLVGTLPFLASFLDGPLHEPSPYSPASRLFWNEFYLDVDRIPELEGCAAARRILESTEFEQELAVLRSSALVDYRRQYGLKRKILEVLANSLLEQDCQRASRFHQFVETHSAAADYASFRAAGERRQAPWMEWENSCREGMLRPGDYEESVRHYHLYSQWVMQDQIQALAEKTRELGMRFYLDLPLGVHPASYDVWREREIFAERVSGGAPPDAVFTKGQVWDFPPLHPEKIRQQQYRYFIACLRHQLSHAGLLRLDHVMGLHRLFWVPEGFQASQGTYVRYRAEEFYAILSLESHRFCAAVVGENLGTVPSYVNTAMSRHKLQRLYVLQYELASENSRPLGSAPRRAVASLQTHDMPPLAAYIQGLDLQDRKRLGLIEEQEFRLEQQMRHKTLDRLISYLRAQGLLGAGESEPMHLIRSCLLWLARSRARTVLVDLEDLWAETLSQNLPGTSSDSRPNWRRKARLHFEEFRGLSAVTETLASVHQLRQSRGKHNEPIVQSVEC